MALMTDRANNVIPIAPYLVERHQAEDPPPPKIVLEPPKDLFRDKEARRLLRWLLEGYSVRLF